MFFVPSCELVLVLRGYDSLDRERDAVAAAEAERRDAALQVAGASARRAASSARGAARSDRVAERDRAAVDVHRSRIDARAR